jgi:hypothetical protein
MGYRLPASATRPTEQTLELNRVAMWPLTSKRVRAAVLMMAGLSRDRADDSIDTFTNVERGAIFACARMLEHDASVIAQCATKAPVVH